MSPAIALTIAGSDSGGGAGIQADIKTFSALGVYATSVICAVTAQNTCHVSHIETLSAAGIRAQIEAVFSDIRPQAVKIGMLGTAEIIATVAAALHPYAAEIPIVLDPVMVAKSGDKLLDDDAVSALKTRLLPLATLITPNLPEAAVLLGGPQAAGADPEQAQALAALGAQAVLLKGGHGQGEALSDLLYHHGRFTRFSAVRHPGKNTHGTGCTLSAAITAYLAQQLPLTEAVRRAHDYLQHAIRAADRLAVGSGHGPVHHFYQWW